VKRGHRPSVVRCAGPCAQNVSARNARELVLSWARTNSGKGTMTSPQAPMPTKVYVCEVCWRGRIEHKDDFPRELTILVEERAAAIGKHILHFLIPTTHEMFPTERSSAR